MRLAAYGQSDVGRRRDGNEDEFILEPDLGLYAVADGMGGHAAGEVASGLAVDALAEAIHPSNWRPSEARADEAAERLHAAIRDANQRICDSIVEHDDRRGMGTTLVAMIAAGDTAVIAHVGDSRAYRLRAGSLERLTSDHSWVNEQVKLGLLSDEVAQRHPMRNIVTRALGSRQEVQVDVLTEGMRPGDVYLLCSDGLNTMLTDEEIERVLGTHAAVPKRACGALIDAANERGGEDNITVIVISVS